MDLENNVKIQLSGVIRFCLIIRVISRYFHTQLCDTIKEVISNPFKSKFKRLENSYRDRRARSGDFRIVFFVSNSNILITKIGLRKNIYKMDIGCPKLSKKQLRSL